MVEVDITVMRQEPVWAEMEVALMALMEQQQWQNIVDRSVEQGPLKQPGGIQVIIVYRNGLPRPMRSIPSTSMMEVLAMAGNIMEQVSHLMEDVLVVLGIGEVEPDIGAMEVVAADHHLSQVTLGVLL